MNWLKKLFGGGATQDMPTLEETPMEQMPSEEPMTPVDEVEISPTAQDEPMAETSMDTDMSSDDTDVDTDADMD